MSQPPLRRPPNPVCPQCRGAGRTRYSVWRADNTWETTEEVACCCTFVPKHLALPDPFPARPDSGDGLPDPDRLDYVRNDYP